MIRLLKWFVLVLKLRRDERIRQTFTSMRTLSWRQRASLVAAVARDPRLPWRVRLAPLLVGFYLASPLDLIPDFVPVLGQLDDLAVISFAIGFIERSLPTGLLDEHMRRITNDTSAEGLA